MENLMPMMIVNICKEDSYLAEKIAERYENEGAIEKANYIRKISRESKETI